VKLVGRKWTSTSKATDGRSGINEGNPYLGQRSEEFR